jgi:hypothetical protein
VIAKLYEFGLSVRPVYSGARSMPILQIQALS